MFNEFQQEIIVTIIILLIVIVYFVLKRRATLKVFVNDTQKSDEAVIATQEKSIVSSVKEDPSPDILVPTNEVVEGLDKVVSIVEHSTNRRKSDIIIQKRSAPANLSITKQNFSEFACERILVAEDNIINQKVLLGLLAGSGIDLVIANDGQEALDILENDTNFIMILMDANMPRVDGFEATRRIRENSKYDHIVVVALSGDTASDDIQKMKDAGMSEQLAKPLRMESLYKIIYAYTAKETTINEDVVVIKNLDVEKGLETCGGDEGFYREILSEFLGDYGHSSDKLGEFLRANNIHDADAHLLDIIGVTENIGAHFVGAIASNLKLALNDTRERSYYSLFDQYKAHFEALTKDIKNYLR